MKTFKGSLKRSKKELIIRLCLTKTRDARINVYFLYDHFYLQNMQTSVSPIDPTYYALISVTLSIATFDGL